MGLFDEEPEKPSLAASGPGITLQMQIGHPEGWPLKSPGESGGLPLVLAPVDEVAESCGGAGDGLLVRALLVVLDLGAAGFVMRNRTQAEAHLLLFDVDLDDFEVVLLADLELRGLAGLFAGF